MKLTIDVIFADGVCNAIAIQLEQLICGWDKKSKVIRSDQVGKFLSM